MPRILLHSCCGPCAIIPLQFLREQDWTVHGFFFNPHIQPYTEWCKRLETLEAFAERLNLPLIVRPDYDLEAFFRQVAFRESARCLYCYAIRLEATARLAAKSRFDAFTTTLLYSKRQKHDLIRTLAEEASRKHSISFVYEDFRVGWKEGQDQAKTMGMYRQQYCGCLYSEWERYKAEAESEKNRSTAKDKERMKLGDKGETITVPTKTQNKHAPPQPLNPGSNSANCNGVFKNGYCVNTK